MTVPSISEVKKRERMRLSNLFEHLSTRRMDTVHEDITTGKNQMPPVPEEFSIVLRNLSVIRRSHPSEGRHPRTRRNTVAPTPRSEYARNISGNTSYSQENNEGHMGEFPLGKERYPFTFKHMIHKLYKKDEWLRTIKEVLEKSRKDFKPLAEYDLNQNHSNGIDSHESRVKTGGVPPPRVRKRAGKGKELRRISMANRHNELPGGGESLRASKKQCVRIRKSMSGNSNTGDQEVSRDSNRGSFVFASATSSTERAGKEIYLNFPLPQVSPSESCFSDTGEDTSTPHSPLSPITPTSPSSLIPLDMTGCAVGTKRRVTVNHQVVMLKAVPISRLAERNIILSSGFSSTTNEDLD